MARVSYGAFVTEINGSIGGTTFQSNRYGFSVKNKNYPGNSNSTSRVEVKNAIRAISQHWNVITQIQRDAWNTFAATYPQPSKHNSSSYLSGFAIFLKYNFWYFIHFDILQDSPGANIPLLAVFSPTLVISGSDLIFNEHPSFSESFLFISISLSAPVNPSLTYGKNRTRYIGFTYATGDGISLASKYIETFGSLPPVSSFVFCTLDFIGVNAPKFFSTQYFKLQIS